MSSATHELSFGGALLARGFWLYVWEVRTRSGKQLYYVGRTGDSSSPNAQSPFNRLGQHLGANANSSGLRNHLTSRGVDPEQCEFRLVAHGPIFAEAATEDEHRRPRNDMAAFERELAHLMREAGYAVMNSVRCKTVMSRPQCKVGRTLACMLGRKAALVN